LSEFGWISLWGRNPRSRPLGPPGAPRPSIDRMRLLAHSRHTCGISTLACFWDNVWSMRGVGGCRHTLTHPGLGPAQGEVLSPFESRQV
jgi:hypothetical protein